MPRTFPLAAVLALREQKEQAEERALMAIGADIQQVQLALSRVRQELAQSAALRAREIETVRSGAQHQANYARHKVLYDAQADLLGQIQQLELRRRDQQAVYLAAKAAREMLTELEKQGRAAWNLEEQRRDQRRLDDLFTARRLRH